MPCHLSVLRIVEKATHGGHRATQITDDEPGASGSAYGADQRPDPRAADLMTVEDLPVEQLHRVRPGKQLHLGRTSPLVSRGDHPPEGCGAGNGVGPNRSRVDVPEQLRERVLLVAI